MTRPPIFLTFAVVLLALSIVVGAKIVSGGGSRYPDVPLISVSDEFFVAVQQLTDGLSSLEGALAGIKAKLAGAPKRLTDAEGAHDNDLLITEVIALRKAVEVLGVQIGNWGNVSQRGPSRQLVASVPKGVSIREQYASARDARRGLLFMSYPEVLRRLGIPERVSGGTTVSWYYPGGTTVFFTDGMATNIDY